MSLSARSHAGLVACPVGAGRPEGPTPGGASGAGQDGTGARAARGGTSGQQRRRGQPPAGAVSLGRLRSAPRSRAPPQGLPQLLRASRGG